MTETIQQLKEDIALLQMKLRKLEELQRTKTPAEEAFRKVYYRYPDKLDDKYGSAWDIFEKGYNASQEPEKEQKWDVIRESVKWCEEHPEKSVKDYLKPHTPEQVDAGLKEAFREAVKQGVVSSSTKRQNLYDIICDCMVKYNSTVYPGLICDILDAIEEWLPKPQSAAGSQNVDVEFLVDGYNDCLNEIKSKLR